jgi:anti-anti-sigma factor
MNPNDTCLTLRVTGDLLSTKTDAIRAEADKLLGGPADAPRAWAVFKLDLTGAKMIDSAGLNLVVSMLKRVRLKGGKMQVAYANPNLLRTFVFTRLDEQVELIKN